MPGMHKEGEVPDSRQNVKTGGITKRRVDRDLLGREGEQVGKKKKKGWNTT